MPTVAANGLTVHYDRQGSGPPLVLIPFLGADNSCYGFQVGDYARHFDTISVDLRGAGRTDQPGGTYTTELFADDIAAVIDALRLDGAHVAGMSLGSAPPPPGWRRNTRGRCARCRCTARGPWPIATCATCSTAGA